MKLTIIRLTTLSEQDNIDLGKIWPDYQPRMLQLDENNRLYAARFNERLLGAVKVKLASGRATLEGLCVREITRRRGVGLYLMSETLADNPQVAHWEMSARDIEDREAMDAFMQALGFDPQPLGWVKQR